VLAGTAGHSRSRFFCNRGFGPSLACRGCPVRRIVTRTLGAASCRPARVKLRFAGDRGDTIRVQLPVAVALAALNELDRVAMPVCDPSGASIRSAAVVGKRETL
jgi:hypothetical protein